MGLERLALSAFLLCSFESILRVDAKAFSEIPGFGRNLIIRTFPSQPDFQSNLYEVYTEPLFYEPSRPPLRALAVLSGDPEGLSGELNFTQWGPGGPVLVEGNVTGLTPGAHGLFIAEKGDLRMGCESTGRHFNPYLHRHGGPRDPIRHLGDLGNIRADGDGVANIKLVDPIISLSGPRNVVGRSLVLTSNEDDLGRANTEESAINGTAGRPVACGIIGYL